jgi:hypothetical protein
MTDRFNYSLPSDWKHCTPGDPLLRERFPLLATLNVPFGTTSHDETCRSGVLLELLKLNETLGFPSQVSANHIHQMTVLKIPRMKKPEVVRLRRTNTTTGFVDTLLESMTTTGTKEEVAEVLSGYLAKYHNNAFCSAIEVAQKVEKKNRTTQPFIAPDGLTMYDGGARDEPLHVNWNVRYHELLAFKEEYGHCLVPTRPNNKQAHANEKYRRLMKWVSYQRTNYNSKLPSLTPKRIQLLEDVGFVFCANPDHYDAKLDPKFHKAIAAKLRYNITARDSMLLSGMSDEEATDESRKKLLNARVCNFYKEEFKYKGDVQAILNTLKLTASDEEALSLIFGASVVLSSLCREGKFILREPQDEASDPGTSDSSDDGVDNRKRAPDDRVDNRKRPPHAPPIHAGAAPKRIRPLPLAHDVSGWL